MSQIQQNILWDRYKHKLKHAQTCICEMVGIKEALVECAYTFDVEKSSTQHIKYRREKTHTHTKTDKYDFKKLKMSWSSNKKIKDKTSLRDYVIGKAVAYLSLKTGIQHSGKITITGFKKLHSRRPGNS